jgi:uncharacterized membrane protein
MFKKPYFIRIYHETFNKDTYNRFQKNLLTGFFIALPAIATIWILSIMVKIIGSPFGKILNNIFAGGRMEPSIELLLGFIIAILLLSAFGFLAKLSFMRSVFSIIEEYIENLPVVSSVYSTIKSFVSAITSNSKSFKSVAIVEYPSKGIFSIGFITQETFPTVKTESDIIFRNMTAVFIPTTPNPTSGFFILLPKEKVEILEISIEDGLKLIISAGAVGPTERAELMQNDAFAPK